MTITKKYIDLGYTLIPIDKIITVEWHEAYHTFRGVGLPSRKYTAKGVLYTTYGKEYEIYNEEDFDNIKNLLLKS